MPVWWAVCLLAPALVARIVAAVVIGDSFHFADEAGYVDTARRLSGGGGFGVRYSGVPAYPVFLALLSVGSPAGVVFLRVAQATVAALGVILVFLLGERTFGSRVGLAAALVYALDPLLVITSGLLYPEIVAAVVLTGIVFLALQAAERDSLASSISTGALLAVLAMLRPVALVVPPVVAAWVALTVAARPGRRVVHAAGIVLAFAIVLSPWIARNYRLHREMVPMTTPGAHTAPVPPAEIAQRGLPLSLVQWAWQHPDVLVSRLARQFVQFWELTPTRMVTDDPVRRQELHHRDPRLEVRPLFSQGLRNLVSAASFSIELLLAVVGIIVVARSYRSPTLLLLGVIIVWALGYALFAVRLRYRIPVLPLLFVFTGAGAVAGYSWIRRLTRNQPFRES